VTTVFVAQQDQQAHQAQLALRQPFLDRQAQLVLKVLASVCAVQSRLLLIFQQLETQSMMLT
jgi:hypothetical protein